MFSNGTLGRFRRGLYPFIIGNSFFENLHCLEAFFSSDSSTFKQNIATHTQIHTHTHTSLGVPEFPLRPTTDNCNYYNRVMCASYNHSVNRTVCCYHSLLNSSDYPGTECLPVWIKLHWILPVAWIMMDAPNIEENIRAFRQPVACKYS